MGLTSPQYLPRADGAADGDAKAPETRLPAA
jgi:hypothetical protein